MLTDSEFAQLRESHATKLRQRRIFTTRTDNQTGQGFTGTSPRKHSPLPLSPYQLNFGLLFSFPNLTQALARLLLEKEGYDKVTCNLVGASPVMASALVASVSYQRERPIVIPDMSTLATESPRVIGAFERGQTAVVIESALGNHQLITGIANTLRKAGLVVNDVFVLVDMEEGGVKYLTANGLTTHAIWTLSELVEFYQSHQMVTDDLAAEIMAYNRKHFHTQT